ncbi:MAG TPA: DUF3341 domain-containing protein, partial [Gemmatimonadales bacterium]|nr:DUF3341 domain-containing protein [Gemmatimonadales bacterium]
MAGSQVPGVLGSFEHVDGAADAIRELKRSGHADLTVYTAAPNHEIEEAIGDPISPVRLVTLVGGVLGCSAGFALALTAVAGAALIVSKDFLTNLLG